MTAGTTVNIGTAIILALAIALVCIGLLVLSGQIRLWQFRRAARRRR